MSEVLTLREQVALVNEEIARVEVMLRVREATGGARYCGVFIDRLGELYAERREIFARLRDDRRRGREGRGNE